MTEVTEDQEDATGGAAAAVAAATTATTMDMDATAETGGKAASVHRPYCIGLLIHKGYLLSIKNYFDMLSYQNQKGIL